MHDVAVQLRVVADDAPPTSIDLDDLIAGERRRSRLRRLTGVGSGVVASVALAALVLGPGVDPSFDGEAAPAATVRVPQPVPELGQPSYGCSVIGYATADEVPPGLTVGEVRTSGDSAGIAEPGLEPAVNQVLAGMLPAGARPSDRTPRSCYTVRVSEPYFAMGPRQIGPDGAVGWFSLAVWLPVERDLGCAHSEPDRCERTVRTDGTVIRTVRASARSGAEYQLGVQSLRRDGSTVHVTLSNVASFGIPGDTRDTPVRRQPDLLPLSEAQLVTIATAPALTLRR